MIRFPGDKRTSDIDQQFLWGSSLLISPVVNPNTRQVFAYFPKSRWFDYYTGHEIPSTGRIHEIDAPSDYLPLHVRGDSILATQEPANNTRNRLGCFFLIKYFFFSYVYYCAYLVNLFLINFNQT